MLLTLGTFDVPHMGHAYFLGKCALFDRDVVVGINSDRFVTEYKGSPPLYDENERMEIMRAMDYRVELNDGPGFALIKRVKPDILAIGMDWFGRDYEKQIGVSAEDFEDWNIMLLFVPNRIMSTTTIKERLYDR